MTTRDHILGWHHAAQLIADSMPAPVKPCPPRLVPVTERIGAADVDPEPNPKKAATKTHAGFSIGDRIAVFGESLMQEGVYEIGDAGRIIKLDPRDDTALVEFDASPTVSDGRAVLDGKAPRQWWASIHSIRPEAAPAAALGDGWIEWAGGECPIPEAGPYQWAYRSRGGIEKVSPVDAKGLYRWNHEHPNPNDFVAYRLIPTEAA
jgi:hypothetical protein